VGWNTFRHSLGTMLAVMGEHQLIPRLLAAQQPSCHEQIPAGNIEDDLYPRSQVCLILCCRTGPFLVSFVGRSSPTRDIVCFVASDKFTQTGLYRELLCRISVNDFERRGLILRAPGARWRSLPCLERTDTALPGKPSLQQQWRSCLPRGYQIPRRRGPPHRANLPHGALPEGFAFDLEQTLAYFHLFILYK
jgi:hypothetical protein